MGASENQFYDYMPVYTFDYEKATLPYSENQVQQVTRPIGPLVKILRIMNTEELKDNWVSEMKKEIRMISGIEENTIDAWSLNKITTPRKYH